MRQAFILVLLAIFLLAPGGFYLWAQTDAPTPIVLDEFASRSFDKSLWRVAPKRLVYLQSDGAARLTYHPGVTYSRRETITTSVPLPEQYVVQVDMLGGVRVAGVRPAVPATIPGAAPTGQPTGPVLPVEPGATTRPFLPGMGAGMMPGMGAGMMPGMGAGMMPGMMGGMMPGMMGKATMGESNFQSSPSTSSLTRRSRFLR